MATRGVGVATISFPASPQAAEYVSATVVSDSSPNPNAWFLSRLPVATNWPVVVYGGGKYVAACNVGNSAHSTDGINWDRSITQVLQIADADYGNGVFVGVNRASANTESYTSSNGTVWTRTGAAMPTSAKWSSVAFGNGIFVAVAITTSSAGAKSSDGITWSASTLPSTGDWYVGFGNGLFVAVKSNSNVIATSADGVTWSETTILPAVRAWNSVCYGNGVFVVSGTGGITSSSDLINWSPLTTDGWSRANGVAFGGGKFLAVVDNNNAVVSQDGLAWLRLDPPESTWHSTPCYGGGQFVVLGDSTDSVFRMVDNVRTVSTVNTLKTPAKASPGVNQASVTVTGLSEITTNSSASAFLLGYDSTATHNAFEHEIVELDLTCDSFVSGVGFTITATSAQRLEGDFKVRYAWGN
jgi:hypothetical protein